MPLLSIIIPVYNEAKTIRDIIDRISAIDIDKEIVVVNDGSTDETARILRDFESGPFKIIHHSSNRGKGAAFLTGLANATGDYVIIQDADLEYNPKDHLKLISAIRKSPVDMVLGARFTKGYHGLVIHRLGNKVLTALLNLLFFSRLNDYATCYKLAHRSTWGDLNLKARGFDIDVEIVCKAIKKNKVILEVPVSYYPRSFKEGKKIRLRDAFWAAFYMFKYRF